MERVCRHARSCALLTSMQDDYEKANIIITHVSATYAKDFFVEWQCKLQDIIANFSGFVSLQILAPNKERSSWMLIQRFQDVETADIWKNSIERKSLFDELNKIEKHVTEEIFSAERNFSGLTEVIVTEVDPEKKNLYGKWLAKIHEAEAKLSGFRGMYVQAPAEKQGRYWLTFLQFDTVENLDTWLMSDERQALLKELPPLIKSFETHRVISPYAGWFGSLTKTASIALWKQTMLILLVLFPIVMIELKFLSPLTKSLDISLATFISNAISVILISWPMMPLAIACFRWWLTPSPWNLQKVNVAGALAVSALYLLEVIIFWHFF